MGFDFGHFRGPRGPKLRNYWSSMKPLTAPIGGARSAAPGIYVLVSPPNYYF